MVKHITEPMATMMIDGTPTAKIGFRTFPCRRIVERERETSGFFQKWNPIAIVCWIAGFAVGEVTSIMNAGIPGLNSLILAGVLYWIVMKVYASMKKVDTVTFTETDQVL